MTPKTTTVCDNCGIESPDPKGEGWQKINLHPWEPGELPEQGQETERWTVRDLCPRCAAKVRQWLQGDLAAVFRLPRGSKEPPGPETEPERGA